MNNSHEHTHSHCQNHQSESNLKIAFWLNVVFAIIEIAGGIFTNSMAILSNAFHDMGDSAALGLAWYFQRISSKERDEKYTYGYKRFSLVGATISSLILLAGSVIIVVESIPRLLAPEPVNAQGMLYLAIVGITINGLAMFKLKSGNSQNEKVISIHLLEDVLGWIAVLLASIALKFFNIPILDPLLSLLITAFILFRVFGNMRQIFRIFMQATPSEEKINFLKAQLATIEGVKDVHDLHFWTLDGTYNIASLHVIVDPEITVLNSEIIKQKVRELFSTNGFAHTTIEIESDGELCELHNC